MTTSPGVRRTSDAARPGRLLPRLVLVLLIAASSALTGPAPTAQAHAFLSASNPGDGEVLASAPTQLRLDFSESVVLGATRIDIVDGAGRHITPTGLRLVSHDDAGDTAGDTERPVTVMANLPALAHSSYRIVWETVSSDDLHSTGGVLVFGVGQPVTAGGLSEPWPSPLESALRWLILLGLSGALGGALAMRLLDSIGGRDDKTQVAGKVAVRGAALGAGAAVILLVGQLAVGGTSGTALLWSSYGVRWGLREGGLLLLVASATVRVRTLSAGLSRVLLALGASLACVGTALLGHSGAGAVPDITRIIASAAHLGAAATWAGCLAVLTWVLVMQVRSGQPGRDLTRAALRGFGPPAAVCVSVMVVTGLYLSSKVIGSLDAALFTIYGRTLLLKVVLAGAAGLLALVTTLRLHRSGRRATPRRTVMAEAVVALGVLALAAVLTSGQPAMEPQLVQTAAAASTVVDGPVADLQETVSISPNRPGAGVVVLDVFETRRPSPGPVRAVLVSFIGASGRSLPQPAERLSPQRWSLATQLVVPGPIQVQVLVRRDGLPDATRSFRWTVGSGQAPTIAAVFSTAPVGGLLERMSAALLCLVLATWVLVPWLRRRRRVVQPHGQRLDQTIGDSHPRGQLPRVREESLR